MRWTIDSHDITEDIILQRHISIYSTNSTINDTLNISSILTITALPINDDVSIGCHIYTTDPVNINNSADMQRAFLYVNGKKN